jgi:hypothetical protein
MVNAQTLHLGQYRRQRRWSDQFIPAIKRIVGPYLLEESSFEVDTKQAADLVVVRAKNLTIAARIRRANYYQNRNYRYQFTVRSFNNGHKTELQKITDGWGDWMLYGFAASDDENETEIAHWRLLDLDVFRASCIRKTYTVRRGDNGDGTAFVAFDIPSFPSDLVIATSEDIDVNYTPTNQELPKTQFMMEF